MSSWTADDFAAGLEVAKQVKLEIPSGPKTLEEGCSTTLVAVLDPALPNGAYLDDCQVKKPNPKVEDPEAIEKLWEVTEKIVGQKFA